MEFELAICHFLSAGIAQLIWRLATDWTVRGSNPGGTRFFAHVHTGPAGLPASCTMGTGSLTGLMRPVRGADHPPSSRPLWDFRYVTWHLYLHLSFPGCYSATLNVVICRLYSVEYCNKVLYEKYIPLQKEGQYNLFGLKEMTVS
jgi:hypothetical protein